MSPNSSLSQGFNAVFEPQLLEQRIRFYKLTPSKHDISSPLPITENVSESNKNYEKTWNFTKSSPISKYNNPKKQVYVHPLDKSSIFSLSSKGLEMCTESLGCETGCGIDTSKEEYAYLLLKTPSSSIKKKPITRKAKHVTNFPPPLTSISGNDTVKVTTYREGGRLVIKSTTSSSSGSCFHTERANGRLMLSFRKLDNNEVCEEEKVEGIEKIREESDCKVEADFGFLMEQKMKEDEGKVGCKIGNGEWSISRCNNVDRSGDFVKFAVCVAIS